MGTVIKDVETMRHQVRHLSGTVVRDSEKIRNIESMVIGLVNNFGVHVEKDDENHKMMAPGLWGD